MELTIDGQVYKFTFGMGFLREINRQVQNEVAGIKDYKENIGLRIAVAELIDGDVEKLVDVLDVANKTENPRLTKQALEAYIEDASTDIDALFEEVLDFLKQANCTKGETLKILQTTGNLKTETAE